MFRRHGRSQGDARGGPGPEETELAATGDPGEGGVSAGGGSWREREYFDAKAGRVVRYRIERLGPGLAVSVVGGLASGLLGIGGGIIKVPVMNLAMKVPMRVAVATSNFMVGITAAASAVVYYANGLVDPLVASAAAAGGAGGREPGRQDRRGGWIKGCWRGSLPWSLRCWPCRCSTGCWGAPEVDAGVRWVDP